MSVSGTPSTALTGRAIVITGAARGLGLAYAKAAAAEGAAVVLNDVDGDELEAAAEEIRAAGGSAEAMAGSVADWSFAQRLVAGCVDRFGAIDGLVNNAGIFASSPPWETDEALSRRIVDVNLLGAIAVGTHALAAMVRQQSGSVVNTTSSALMGRPGLAVYGATKAALLSVTSSWAIDGREHGVRVNAFSPSARTRMTAGAPSGVGGQPPAEANAPVVTYLLSDHSAGVTGQAVQLERDRLIIFSPARLSEHAATVSSPTLAGIVEHFDPVLRANLQPVGWWPQR